MADTKVYLSGGRIQGRSDDSVTTQDAIAQTSWKELDRVTLGSAGDVLDCNGSGSGFTAKDNLMILIIGHKSGNAQIEDLTFNGDTGSNYARRYSENGSSSTETSQDSIQFGIDSEDDEFAVITVRNTADKEKLLIGHTIARGSTGAGYIGNRLEVAGKWANTSNQITRVTLTNPHDGNLDTGSEMVILGCDDDEADSGTNFWGELGSNTLTAEGDVLTTTIAAKKYLMVDIHPTSNSSNTSNNPDYNLTFNGATSGYAGRSSQNGGSDGTFSSGAFINGWLGYQDRFVKAYVINVASKEKMAIGHDNAVGNSGFGAGTAPQRNEWVGKWANTSDSITTVTSTNSSARPSTYGVGASIRVWGSN